MSNDNSKLAWGILYTDLSCLGIALILTITNTVAFSRCDKFSQASTFANRALGGGIVNNLAGGLLGRFFR